MRRFEGDFFIQKIIFPSLSKLSHAVQRIHLQGDSHTLDMNLRELEYDEYKLHSFNKDVFPAVAVVVAKAL